jgi:hypothetical protein
MAVTGRAQTFVNFIPSLERIWHGDEVIPLPAERIFEGVGTYDVAHRIFFWGLSEGIHAYSYDGSKLPRVFTLPLWLQNKTIQAMVVDPSAYGFTIYVILPNGDIHTYSATSEGDRKWSTEPVFKLKDKVREIVWNFAVINSEKRLLYFAGMSEASSLTTLYRVDLNTMEYTAMPAFGGIKKSVYNPKIDTFYWLELDYLGANVHEVSASDARVVVRLFSPSIRSGIRIMNSINHEALATTLQYEHKIAFNPREERFFVLDPYRLKVFIFGVDDEDDDVEVYRTRLTYPIHIEFAPSFRL